MKVRYRRILACVMAVIMGFGGAAPSGLTVYAQEAAAAETDTSEIAETETDTSAAAASEEIEDEAGSSLITDAEPVFYENPDGGIVDETDDAETEEDETGSGTLLSVLSSSSGSAALLTIDSGLSYTDSDTLTMQIANEALNGIYFFSDGDLDFYSLDTYTLSDAYEFSNCTSVYAENDMLYVLTQTRKGVYSGGSYTYTYTINCEVYDLNNNKLSKTISFNDLLEEDTVTSVTAVGADASGRIYIATTGIYESDSVYQVWLYSSSGTLLSMATVGAYVYSFSGFDSESGNFYMESYYNWVYWGYDHAGYGVTMGTVTNNKITFTETGSSVLVSGLLTYNLDCLEYICQLYYYKHQKGADVIGDKYLVTASTTFGRVQIFDAGTLDSVLYISRSAIEEDQSSTYDDLNSIGVRAVYNEANDSIVVYENEKTLNEYDPSSGEIIGTYQTAHYVFNLLTLGDYVIAIEKEDGQFYMEIINWKAPTKFTISGSSKKMKTGETQQLSLSGDADYSFYCTWTSTDSSIVSVTSDGVVSAWSEGKATIKCKSPDGKQSASYTITVSGSTITKSVSTSKTLTGTVTNNRADNNYTTYYANIVNSYLTENDDGTFTRVEYTGSKILVETYSSSFKLKSTKTISMQLSIFGGFYSGEDYNYIVFGQKNTSESDSKEVIRVVKYSKSWSKISTCSIYGANTYVPFKAGSLRMTELDGLLYIYTCHTMYAEDDSTHHQANMTFVIDESSMTVSDSYYDVLNISQAGYVSHSFDQYIQTDGEYIYRVDLGDAYPRAVSLTKCKVGDSITSVSYTYALEIQGSTGANKTGVSVGGFELSDDNCLIVGNSVDQSSSSSYSASGQRNIFLTVTDKTYLTTETIWLTDYDSDEGITPRTPQLVKISDDQFLIMWEEYYTATSSVATRMVTVNGEGTITSDITCSKVRLSDCQPVVTSSGLVMWYVTNGSTVKLYRINPYDLPDTVTVSSLSTIKLSSATVKLSYTSTTYTGKTKKPSVTVTYNGKTLTKGTNYTVSYASGRKSIGKYKVTIKGTGYYTGTVTKYFKIVPKKVSISSAKSSSKKKITVKWSKVSGGVKYQIAYRKKGSSKWTYMTVGSSTYKKTLTGLSSGKYYYVKVRAYKTVSGTKYYGSWSTTKKIKVK